MSDGAISGGRGRVGSIGDWSRNVLCEAKSAAVVVMDDREYAATLEAANRVALAEHDQGSARPGKHSFDTLDARRTDEFEPRARLCALRARYLGQGACRCSRAKHQAADTDAG